MLASSLPNFYNENNVEPSRFIISLDRDKVLLGLTCFVLLAGTAFLVWWNVSNERKLEEQNQTLFKLVANNVALDHEGAIYGIRQFLITSEYLAEQVERNPENCGGLLRSISTAYPYFLNIGITDAEGAVLCSGIQIGRSVHIGGDSDFQAMQKSKTFTVSDYRISTFTGRPSVRFIQPILGSEYLAGAIFVSFGVEWLNGFSSDTLIPEGMVITKFDKSGTVFFRYPNPLAWSGTNQNESELFKRIQEARTGFITTQGLDGVSRTYYVRPIYHDGNIHAYVAVGRL